MSITLWLHKMGAQYYMNCHSGSLHLTIGTSLIIINAVQGLITLDSTEDVLHNIFDALIITMMFKEEMC